MEAVATLIPEDIHELVFMEWCVEEHSGDPVWLKLRRTTGYNLLQEVLRWRALVPKRDYCG